MLAMSASCSGSAGGGFKVLLWDIAKGKPRFITDRLTSYALVGFNSDGSSLIAAYVSFAGQAHNVIARWDTRRGKTFAEVDLPEAGGVRALSPDGKWLVTGTTSTPSSPLLLVWEVDGGKQVAVLNARKQMTKSRCAAFSLDCKILAVGGVTEQADVPGPLARLVVWDTKTWEQKRELHPHGRQPITLSLSAKGDRLAGCFTPRLEGKKYFGGVEVWNTSEEKGLPVTFATHGAEIAEISPDGTLLAKGYGLGGEYAIEIWSLTDDKSIKKLDPESNVIRGVVFSRDGALLAAVTGPNEVRIWKLQADAPKKR
jgi:WD40 repeat protein